MELPSLGQHCFVSECRQLDFLPFVCAYCAMTFCKEHFGLESHDCEKRPDNTVTEKRRNEDVYMCSVDGCRKTELAPIRCSRCGVQICLSHRAEQDHACSEYEPPKERMVKTREVVESIAMRNDAGAPSKTKLHRNPKAQRMAAKVQLMKLKQRSKGDQSLPAEERIYLRVIPPKKGGKAAAPPVGAFVSRKWSMGRVIDALASSCGVENRNNVAGSKKLRLFRFQDGQNLCLELEKAIERFVEGEQVFNGDSVVLEYKDEELVSEDINPKEYSTA